MATSWFDDIKTVPWRSKVRQRERIIFVDRPLINWLVVDVIRGARIVRAVGENRGACTSGGDLESPSHGSVR